MPHADAPALDRRPGEPPRLQMTRAQWDAYDAADKREVDGRRYAQRYVRVGDDPADDRLQAVPGVVEVEIVERVPLGLVVTCPFCAAPRAVWLRETALTVCEGCDRPLVVGWGNFMPGAGPVAPP
ncbi:hypothetical protein [Roseisolibacter sp. H3M3-2]|uniref:hypothetical protein n=1 Tax=Roseisolibacter sp. H3M3-2 TaxID=3031323 RepID=UPI0023DCEA05|nr:hypothetical protein [Roseisolibacter sp. H3M3-2]MDF1504854.1 hypothetical protein [Roseisolibacter sp. H3M3-2]